MLESKISSKGQVTIPKEIREYLKVKGSDKIFFTPLENGKVLITTKGIPASAFFGLFKHRKTKKTVSLEEMDSVIKKRRSERIFR